MWGKVLILYCVIAVVDNLGKIVEEESSTNIIAGKSEEEDEEADQKEETGTDGEWTQCQPTNDFRH